MKSRDEILGDASVSRRLTAYWRRQIDASDEENAKWHRRGDDIVKRYKDDRSRVAEEGTRRLNMLWSNTSILLPAIYGRCPTPVAQRSFLDHDPVGRLAAQIMERSLRNEIKDNGYHQAIRRAVKDYLLPGRGVCWVRYEPVFGESPSLPPSSMTGASDGQGDILGAEGEFEDEATEKLGETGSQVIFESAPVDYIHWKDFYVFPPKARTWDEVTAVGKKVYLSKDECMERFGEETGAKIQPDAGLSMSDRVAGHSGAFEDLNERKRVVYEIWNKADRKVYWVSTGFDALCDVLEDPLGLKGFFPVPEPLSATMTNDSVTPVPDYIEYQDQAIQIDELTQRIFLLTKACKVAGLYDAANRPIRRLLDETVENELVPVDDWARYGDKGVAGAISFMPLKEIMETLDVLMGVKERMLQDLDRVTGISDVLRGTTDGRETMGGTRLKTNNAGTRIDERRNEVARFAADVLRLVAEVAAKHFSAKTLIEISGVFYDDEFEPLRKLKKIASEAQQTTVLSAPQMGVGPLSPAPVSPMAPPQLGPLASPSLPGGGQGPQFGAPPPPMAPPPAFPHAGAPNAPAPQNPELPSLLQESKALVSRLSQAVALLRNDIDRSFRIDIEPDSTISGDAAEERRDAVEFVGGVTKFLETAAMIGASQPMAAPLLGKMLQFAVRKFRTGRSLESSLDEFVAKAETRAKEMLANPQTKPDPEALKAQAAAAKAQAEIISAQLEAKAAAENDQRDRERRAMEHQAHMAHMQMELETKRESHKMKLQEILAAQVAKELSLSQEKQVQSDPNVPNNQILKAQHDAAKARADILKTELEAAVSEHNARLEIERARAEHELRMSEIAMNRQLQRAEQGAKLSQLRRERVSGRDDVMFRRDQLEHQREGLKAERAAKKRENAAAPLVAAHGKNITRLEELAKKIEKMSEGLKTGAAAAHEGKERASA